MHRTVRNVWGGRLRMERETSRQAGWSCRRPSPRSRWCCRSRSWTATLRHCSRTRRPRPRSCASSCLNGLAWKISSAFHSTSLSLIRSAQLRFVLWYRLSVICWLLCFVLVVLMLLEKHSFFTWKVSILICKCTQRSAKAESWATLPKTENDEMLGVVVQTLVVIEVILLKRTLVSALWSECTVRAIKLILQQNLHFLTLGALLTEVNLSNGMAIKQRVCDSWFK